MNETYNIPINQPGSGCGSAGWATTEPNMPDANRQQSNCTRSKGIAIDEPIRQASIAELQDQANEILAHCLNIASSIQRDLTGLDLNETKEEPIEDMRMACSRIVAKSKELYDMLQPIGTTLFNK